MRGMIAMPLSRAQNVHWLKNVFHPSFQTTFIFIEMQIASTDAFFLAYFCLLTAVGVLSWPSEGTYMHIFLSLTERQRNGRASFSCILWKMSSTGTLAVTVLHLSSVAPGWGWCNCEKFFLKLDVHFYSSIISEVFSPWMFSHARAAEGG